MRELLCHGWRLLPNSLRQVIKHLLFRVRDMSTRLQTLRRAGFVCTGAIDGGAFYGEWAREFWSAFPSVPVLMVEPQNIPQPFLRELAGCVPGSDVLSVAPSDQPGLASFVLQESNSGTREGTFSDEESIDVPCLTLVEILAPRTGFSPNLLKLDLQGHELQAMKGAVELLKSFEVIVCELSLMAPKNRAKAN